MVKNPSANAGDMGSIPGLGRPPGEGNGNPLQYFCMENPMDRGPGRLQSMWLQRAEHDLATEHVGTYCSFIYQCNHLFTVIIREPLIH